MAPRPTLIGSRVIGVDLPAFLLSKSVYSESIGTPQHSAKDFAFVFRSFATASEIPRGTSSCPPLATNHYRKIKNPASSAGYSHPYLGDSTRCSTSF
jgi:hypothetical protein